MKYKTRIDDLYCVLICCFFAASYTLSISIIILNASKIATILGIMFLIIVTLVCYFICERYYIFEDNEYIVKVGFISKKYYYSDIKKCFITSNNKLSYATSQKRICIKTSDKTFYISPENIDDALLILINRRVS